MQNGGSRMENLSNTVTYKVLYNTIAVLVCYLTVVSKHSYHQYVSFSNDQASQ